jgi:antitoxin MazE
MKATIQRWGNSQAIRIPSKVSHVLNLNDNDVLELIIEDKKLILKKSKPRPENITQLYELFYGKPIEEILAETPLIEEKDEFVWGNPVGREEW